MSQTILFGEKRTDRREKKNFFGAGSIFWATERTFYEKNGSISYGNDPFCDPLGPPDDKIDPFRDAKDRLGE